jgi:hypothetical protein
MATQQNHPQLGRVAAELIRIMDGYENDPISQQHGIFPDYTQDMLLAVRREGFANLRHFYAVLRERAGERWVHHNMPCFTTELDRQEDA